MEIGDERHCRGSVHLSQRRAKADPKRSPRKMDCLRRQGLDKGNLNIAQLKAGARIAAHYVSQLRAMTVDSSASTCAKARPTPSLPQRTTRSGTVMVLLGGLSSSPSVRCRVILTCAPSGQRSSV